MNNIKLIRELYGATQEQLAKALGVNRVTVANWEIGVSTASSANRERMSIYFGVGPEYFYDKELDNTAKEIIIKSAEKANEIIKESNGQRNKEDDFNKMINSITFAEAMSDYMFYTKILLAVSDSGDLDKLETALLINKKMGARLDAIIKLRKEEVESGEPTLSQLLEDLNNS